MENIMIDNLLNVKYDIKSAIERRGVNPTGGMTTYADSIDRIQIHNNNNGVLLEYSFGSSYRAYADIKLGHSIFVENPKILFKYENNNLLNYVFNNCKSLKQIQLFDISTVAYMNYAFNGCSALVMAPPFDTSNVIEMHGTFSGCTSLTTVPQFDTSNVTAMRDMFRDCISLTTVPQFDTSKVGLGDYAYNDMHRMFYNCSSLEYMPDFNTQYVDNISYMFSGCTLLREVGSFTGCHNMNYMFKDCVSLSIAPQCSLGNYVNGMFSGCTSLTTVPLMDASSVKEMVGMFNTCTNLEDIRGFIGLGSNLSSSGVNMFLGCKKIARSSVINIFENLESVSNKYICFEQEVLNRLSDEDITIATDKGWYVNSY